MEYIKVSKNDQNININKQYFITQEKKNKNELSDIARDNRNSDYNINYPGSQLFNKKVNQEKLHLKNIVLSDLNNFKKINNIYENNYVIKHYNTYVKTDNSRNTNLNEDSHNRRNTLNKLEYIKGKRQPQNFYNSNHNYNNTLNFTNYKNPNFKINTKEIFTERSHNKDFKDISGSNSRINNLISINDLTINRQNKQKNIKDEKYTKGNTIDSENEKLKLKNHHRKNNSNNKSMDSKQSTKKGVNNHGNHIININNGKIINLSNLNGGFSYATEKYSCFYQNKRDPNIKLKEKPFIKNTELNVSKYYKKVNKKVNEDKNQTSIPIPNPNPRPKKISGNNTTFFGNKYPKKENNKYPLRINYTTDNLNYALENQSPIQNKIEKPKEIKDYTTIRNPREKIHFCNSFNDNKKVNKIAMIIKKLIK